MKRIILFTFFSLIALQAYSQHTVNDIAKYNGWFKIQFETSNGQVQYKISQCYPNGDLYEVPANQRRKLPLYIKVLCIGLVEEVFTEQLGLMTFDEDGVFMQVTGFSFILKITKSEAEILENFGQEMVDKYKNRDW
jgi:hypothetical protein